MCCSIKENIKFHNDLGVDYLWYLNYKKNEKNIIKKEQKKSSFEVSLENELFKCANIDDLYEIAKQFKSFPFADQNKNLILGKGDLKNPDIMIIGDSPSNEDDIKLNPFSDVCGDILDKITKAIKCEHVYFSNLSLYQSLELRTEKYSYEKAITTMRLYKIFLEKHISLINPKSIVFLGRIVALVMLEINSIQEAREKNCHFYKNKYMDKKIPTIATYHPLLLIHFPEKMEYKKKMWEDFLLLKSTLKQ